MNWFKDLNEVVVLCVFVIVIVWFVVVAMVAMDTPENITTKQTKNYILSDNTTVSGCYHRLTVCGINIHCGSAEYLCQRNVKIIPVG